MSMRAKWKRTKSLGKEILLSQVQRGCYKQESGGKKKKRQNFRKQSLKSDRKILLMKPCLRAVVKYDVVFTSTVTQAAFTTSPLNTAGRCLPSEICGS